MSASTTLFEAGQWLKALGPDGDRLKVYFVTVDPERDTEAQLAAYLQAFDPRITGLTGPKSALDPMLTAYRVYWKKVGDGDDVCDGPHRQRLHARQLRRRSPAPSATRTARRRSSRSSRR